MRFNPLVAAIDTDHDGVLSAKEIGNAAAALKTLDKNGDGKLTADEVRPNFGGRGRGGPGGSPDEMVKRLMEFDKNGDGKLSKDEVPERMQGMFDRADTNNDGVLTEDEIRKMPRPQRGPGGGGRVDPVFAALDTNHDGELSAAEIANAPAALMTLDKSHDGTLTQDELRPSFGPGRGAAER